MNRAEAGTETNVRAGHWLGLGLRVEIRPGQEDYFSLCRAGAEAVIGAGPNTRVGSGLGHKSGFWLRLGPGLGFCLGLGRG